MQRDQLLVLRADPLVSALRAGRVDDRIARRVSNRFVMEFIGEQRFKGFSAHQRVHRLKSYNHDREVIYMGEMIGRDRELARLDMVIEGSTRGVFSVDAGNLTAEMLSRTDPAPEALKKALGDCD